MGPTWRRHRSSVSATDWGRLVADTFQLSVCVYVVVLVFVFGILAYVVVFVFGSGTIRVRAQFIGLCQRQHLALCAKTCHLDAAGSSPGERNICKQQESTQFKSEQRGTPALCNTRYQLQFIISYFKGFIDLHGLHEQIVEKK